VNHYDYALTPSRAYLGQPQTVGGLRRTLDSLADDVPIAVRNAPLPELYLWVFDEHESAKQLYLEIRIPELEKQSGEPGA
jgi:hypothetical protein